VELEGGEEIEVARLNPRAISVVGLVRKAGVFATDPDAPCNLAQALALAGGAEPMANPRFAKICRQDAQGRLLCRPVRIDGGNLSAAAAVPVRPGDVVVVEQTVETDLRLVMLQVLSVTVGAHGTFQF
jgi:protein involved in polysaccharide export with SLBB domain